jgi:GGDEF domain-containing protein
MSYQNLCWRNWIVLACLCWLQAAVAQIIPAVQTVRLDTIPAASADALPAPMRIVQGLDASFDIAQVSQLEDARFEAFSPTRNYAYTYPKPIWLHLRVSTDAASHGQWQLEFPAILTDRYDVFQKDASGQWRKSVAGDTVPYVDWALPSMRPRFPLHISSAGQHDVYVRVMFRLSGNLQPVLVTSEQGAQRDAQLMLWSGALTGLILAISVACLHMSWAYRNPTYFWYACYLIASLLSMLTYTGLGQRMLWPQSAYFSNNAIAVFVISLLACNAQFCRAMFGGMQGRGYHRAAAVLLALCGAYIALRLLIEDYSRISLFYNLLVVAVFLFIIYSAASAKRRGLAFGGYWLMVYVPYLMFAGLAIVKSIGLLPLVWLPEETPLIAIGVEAVAMMICINIYSRDKHAQTVREQTAARLDPLTGFLNAEHFHRFASRAWEKARKSGRHATVIYVKVEPKDAPDQTALELETMLLNSVRMVRTAMREFDVVGRVGQDLLGICVVDRPSNEALAARLSRLVALGLMPEDPRQAVNFTLAVAEHARVFEPYPQVESILRQLLAVPVGHGRKPIRYFNPTGSPAYAPSRAPNAVPATLPTTPT